MMISLKFIPHESIGDNLVLGQEIDWHGSDEKSLPEPMTTKFYDAIWRH